MFHQRFFYVKKLNKMFKKGGDEMTKEELVKIVMAYEPDRSRALLQSLPASVLEKMVAICEMNLEKELTEQSIELGI